MISFGKVEMDKRNDLFETWADNLSLVTNQNI